MNRRKFLQGIAAATAAMNALPAAGGELARAEGLSTGIVIGEPGWMGAGDVDTTGHTLLCSFKLGAAEWKVYEDLRTRDGAITFVSFAGAAGAGAARSLAKSAEATFPESNPPYLGLKLSDIGMSGPDLLADRLLAGGDPDPEQVKAAAPPMASAPPEHPWDRLPWNTILGTVECSDTMPVFPSGNTRTYHPIQYFPELTQAAAAKRHEGLIGGWMPAARKIFSAPGGYCEVVVFGDVTAHDRFIVQTWHRTALIQDGKISKVQYGYSYPAYPPARVDPEPEEFYRALLIFSLYWEKQLADVIPIALPDSSWVNMSRHAFAKELMVRPGGVYPKYGAVDRDYYGPEYDGFQDIFTMSLYTNLECGRFEMARQVLDNYYSDFVDGKGMVNMRGPETAQFGLTLSLIARYFRYTGDASLLAKHRAKVEATASILINLHDESVKLPPGDSGFGLIHGWCESDSCLMPKPATWWQPYFSNSAFAARGLRDISAVWKEQGDSSLAQEWLRRSGQLQDAVAASIRRSIRHDMTPPYIGPLPGMTLTFWESMKTEHPSAQGWPHRAYAELLQPDILPPDLANTIIDCMRAHGATTLGVVANVEAPHPDGRDILGFISYGYAQMLLRLDRIEEYLLFLYSHRYHDHSRGSWTAGEVSGITGDSAIFCIPAQQTIPLLLRWMLVLEDSDKDTLYLGKGLPREWVASGREIKIEEAPTRWGRVSFRMISHGAGRVTAKVEIPKQGGPQELQVKFRLPVKNTLKSVTVNGKTSKIGGLHRDSAIFAAGTESRFEVAAEFV